MLVICNNCTLNASWVELFSIIFKKKLAFCLSVQKKALPLHSLSGSNVVAPRLSKMILDNIPYRQAVQRVL